MRKLFPGIYHWTSFHEGIQARVHSYFIDAVEPACLIDPRLPKEGLDWFDDHAVPENIYLTNRHHYRHSKAFVKAFGAEVWCQAKGLHEFTHGEKVRSFKHGQVLPGGVTALGIGSLCDEETAFYLPLHGGILAIGDALVRSSHGLQFVPDDLMGDDPEGVKRGLVEAFRHQIERHPVTHLLLAHGSPVLYSGGKDLGRFLARHRPETAPS